MAHLMDLKVFAFFLCAIGLASAETCSFRYSYYPYNSYTTTCYYGCCTDDCCTSSSSSDILNTADTATTVVRAWVIGVSVAGGLVGLAIVIAIIRCIVQASKRPTTVLRTTQPQPSVTVVSTGQQQGGQQGSAWAQAGTTYPGYYPAPPGAVPPPPQYYNNPAYPPPPAK